MGMNEFGAVMSDYGLPQDGVDNLKELTEAACWHTVNLKAGVLIDAWRDWGEYKAARANLLQPQGGDFTTSLAGDIEHCLWHTAWETVDQAYGNRDGVIIHGH